MNVLALVTDGFGSEGGIGQYNRDLMTALANQGGTRSITILPRYGDVYDGRVELPGGVTQLPPQPAQLGFSISAARQALSRTFDVIFCGHLFATPLAAGLARLTGARLWAQLHGIEAWRPPGRLVRSAIERSDLVTVVSRHTRNRFLGWANIEPLRVRVLPNTVTRGTRARRSDLARRYGLEGRRIVLTVGRMSGAERYKGHDRIIRALPAVAAQVPSVSYLIGGTGDDRARLEALALETGVAERVVFAGRIAEVEMAEHFALSDVFAMPSTGEGFGIVYLEALAAGVPVVAGNRDGSRDALADGALGALVDPDDTDGLAQALVAAIEGRSPTPNEGPARFERGAFAAHLEAIVLDAFEGGRPVRMA